MATRVVLHVRTLCVVSKIKFYLGFPFSHDLSYFCLCTLKYQSKILPAFLILTSKNNAMFLKHYPVCIILILVPEGISFSYTVYSFVCILAITSTEIDDVERKHLSTWPGFVKIS